MTNDFAWHWDGGAHGDREFLNVFGISPWEMRKGGNLWTFYLFFEKRNDATRLENGGWFECTKKHILGREQICESKQHK
jgi:hypothetical protein